MMQQTMPAKKVTVIPPLPELQPENRTKYRQLRVAAYCRVSTKQEEQENSYETQKAYYTEKIQKNPEWEFVGIFADKGHASETSPQPLILRDHTLHCRGRSCKGQASKTSDPDFAAAYRN